jgi:hypothetical protein
MNLKLWLQPKVKYLTIRPIRALFVVEQLFLDDVSGELVIQKLTLEPTTYGEAVALYSKRSMELCNEVKNPKSA